MASETYGSIVKYLKKHTKIVELKGPGDARIAVAPQYRGRVMTSTLSGGEGISLGWVNKPFIEAGLTGQAFDNYGGEDRFWISPEAGQYSLWFKNGEPFDVPHWKTQEGLNTSPFEITSQGSKSVALANNCELTNYSGTTFQCAIKRTINALTYDNAASILAVSVPAGTSMVAFESVNTLANVGQHEWTMQGGLIGIWNLGMFPVSEKACVILPFIPGSDDAVGPAAVADAFGDAPQPADRLQVRRNYMLFKGDGKFRGKIGVPPGRAKPVIGSYNGETGVLTLVQYNLPGGAAKLPYTNSGWYIQDKPFAGEAVNSYNDLGGENSFYELETNSPAAPLKPGELITHVHRTFHFSGPFEVLRDIAILALGVDLKEATF